MQAKHTWTEPTEEDYTYLAKQWIAVQNLLNQEYVIELDESELALDHLQRIVDDELIDPMNAYGLQCLGCVFGRIIANNHPNLDWWIIEDQYGRDPVLRYAQSSLRLSVLTMISKRIEDGEKVDIRDLYASSIETVEKMISNGEVD